MLLNRTGFTVFNEYDLRAILESQVSQIKKEVESDIMSQKPEDEAGYIAEKLKKHKIKPLEFYADKLTVTTDERMIPAEYFPQNFFIERGGEYPKQVLQFHLPFSGDQTLLRCVPSSRVLWTEEVMIENNEIIFELINFDSSAETIGKDRDKVIDFLKKQSENVNNQVAQHNNDLENIMKETIKVSAEKFRKNSDFLKELGTPLKDNIS